MKLKNNETLAYVANHCGQKPDYVGCKIITGLVNAGFLIDDPDNYGCMLSESIQGDAKVFDVAEIFKQALGVPVLGSDLWDNVNGCVVMGDGDCPECGGELRFVETEGHEINDGDRYTPNSYIVDNYVYVCRNCGEIIKSENEL